MATTEQPIPDFDAFERYLSGQMSRAEQRALEGRMLDEPLVGEAYEGFLMWRNQRVAPPDLRSRLQARTRPARLIPLWAYGAAASVLLVVLAYWQMTPTPEPALSEKSNAVAITRREAPKPPLAKQPAPKKEAPRPRAQTPLAQEPPESFADAPDSTLSYAPKVFDEQTIVGSATAFKRSMPAPTAADTVTRKAAPAAGWDSYNAYLRQNSAVVAADGPVTVHFVVNQSGALSAFTATGPQELQKEAIRIIRGGPAWSPALDKGRAGTTIEEVRLRFLPPN